MKRYTFEFPNFWNFVREARNLARNALEDASVELREHTAMTVSELVENAVKHGDSSMIGVTIALTVKEDLITIEVQNGIGSPAAAERLRSHIDRMRGAPERSSLYVERLQQLMEDPGQTNGLGLYRIYAEAEFDLSAKLDEKAVTVIAIRKAK